MVIWLIEFAYYLRIFFSVLPILFFCVCYFYFKVAGHTFFLFSSKYFYEYIYDEAIPKKYFYLNSNYPKHFTRRQLWAIRKFMFFRYFERTVFYNKDYVGTKLDDNRLGIRLWLFNIFVIYTICSPNFFYFAFVEGFSKYIRFLLNPVEGVAFWLERWWSREFLGDLFLGGITAQEFYDNRYFDLICVFIWMIRWWYDVIFYIYEKWSFLHYLVRLFLFLCIFTYIYSYQEIIQNAKIRFYFHKHYIYRKSWKKWYTNNRWTTVKKKLKLWEIRLFVLKEWIKSMFFYIQKNTWLLLKFKIYFFCFDYFLFF